MYFLLPDAFKETISYFIGHFKSNGQYPYQAVLRSNVFHDSLLLTLNLNHLLDFADSLDAQAKDDKNTHAMATATISLEKMSQQTKKAFWCLRERYWFGLI
tara:strand:+ start:1515 stop:1817 length:303 start_codon:yes stop_codon:yes gene_type:complete